MHATGALYEVHAKGIEIMHRYQPWNLLLAIKWALEEADELSHRRRLATVKDLHAVLNVLHDMEASVTMPSAYEHTSLFMRHLAFQQFWLQHGANGAALVRQELLFSSLPQGHYFSREFRRLTGLRSADFIELSFALLAPLLRPPTPRVIRRDYLQSFASSLTPGALDCFLGHLSKSIPELHAWLRTPEFETTSIADQRIVPSPLLNAPLIRIGPEDYMIVFPILLMRALESVVYRTLRNDNRAEFGVRFGPIFERYVGRCLADAGVNYLDEVRLNAQLSGLGKCVDFLVTDDDCTVLIDAKGVEVSARGRVSQRADLVLGAIKQSAVKALEQGMSTWRRIADASAARTFSQSAGETFLVVVTYDSLFLGSTGEFGTAFGRHLLPDLERKYGAPLPIPLERVFFVTIDEFERLLALVHSGVTTLVGVLRSARARDSTPRTCKFHFQQHLEPFSAEQTRLPMLEAALEDLVQRCATRLRSEKGVSL